MLVLASQMGLALSDFWVSTPREFQCYLDGYIKRQDVEMVRCSHMAIFNRIAYHSKKRNLKATDLYLPEDYSDEPIIMSEDEAREKSESLKQHSKWWDEFNQDLASGKRKFRVPQKRDYTEN